MLLCKLALIAITVSFLIIIGYHISCFNKYVNSKKEFRTLHNSLGIALAINVAGIVALIRGDVNPVLLFLPLCFLVALSVLTILAKMEGTREWNIEFENKINDRVRDSWRKARVHQAPFDYITRFDTWIIISNYLRESGVDKVYVIFVKWKAGLQLRGYCEKDGKYFRINISHFQKSPDKKSREILLPCQDREGTFSLHDIDIMLDNSINQNKE